MYIKSIILDGFKSYGQRTEVHGFDDKFTAITGLNGSGKSNILDAICFVLGISNLSDVRAASLQDLIYKSGQAGVNKATVSIIFDNSDRTQCPPGFEDISEITVTRQIVIGGKNKYMINGTTVQNKKVQDLFCSVQLNVNNPHFLIMQGKITKVLNMKPPEILAMIEEAAGTKMFEIKKQATKKLLDKKDERLQEMEVIITDELYPKLQKLRKEREKYMEFKVLERELDFDVGIYKAWEFLAIEKAAEKGKEAVENAKNQMDEIQQNIAENKAKIKEIEKEISEICEKSESEETPQLKELRAKLKVEEKIEAKINSTIKSLNDDILSEENKKKLDMKSLKDDQATLKSKENELKSMQTQFETFQANDSRLSEEMAAAQRKFEALTAGMEINDDGEAETVLEQLMNAKKIHSETLADKEQSQLQLEHNRQQLKELERNLGSHTADYNKDVSSLESLQKEVKSLEANLGNLKFSQQRWDELHAKKTLLGQQVRPLRGQVENFEASKPFTSFRYRDPETNFNRKSVHGVACNLFQVKDPKAHIALETAAGGRLYNVIVDSNEVGKKLLNNGNLQTRTTFIPLNQIRSKKISDHAVKIAQNLVGGENVQTALSHITYDNRLAPAMEFLFGSVFICRDLNVARKVAFHDKIRSKCVTLDGDIVDPAGTLTGGAAKRGGSILQQIGDLKVIQDDLKQKEHELERIQAEIDKMSQSKEHFNTFQQKLELKSHEMKRIQLRIEQSTHHIQLEEVKALKCQIEELGDKIKLCEENLKKYDRKVKELEFKSKNNSQHEREKQLKEAEAEMNKTKQTYEKSKKDWQKIQSGYDTLKLEIEELRNSIENILKQINSIDENIKTIENQLAETQSTLDELKIKLGGIQDEIKAEMDKIAAKNKEAQRKMDLKEKLAVDISEFELKLRQMGHEIKELTVNYKSLEAKKGSCEKNVNKEDRFFEAASKLNETSGRELEMKIRRARDNRNKLVRTVNPKAQSMLAQEEAQYNDTRKKQKSIENDRNRFLQIIMNLDRQKQKTLTLAYNQISKDFGSIFGTLLPSANAKLAIPKGSNILQGIEIKVCLGNVWKESLTELSGGQRSLAALSLILSMLLFKPAPLYILDEVDAALDLSHTQNIGNMLKSHFKSSQFIIVSLKDGMFNNANVLFRTKFVDGVSTVSRSVNRC